MINFFQENNSCNIIKNKILFKNLKKITKKFLKKMVLEFLPKASKPSLQTNSEAIVYLHTAIKGLELGLVLGSSVGVLYSLVRLRKVNPSKISKFINYGIGI